MSEPRCPLCGKPNPEAQENCQSCGARLKPLVAGAFPGQAEESSRAEKNQPVAGLDADSSIPDWLKSLREGGSAPTQGGGEKDKPHFGSDPGFHSREKSATVDKTTSGDEIPDWLAGLRNMATPVGGDELSRAGEPSLPGSMPAEKQGELPSGITSNEVPADTPDWLSRLEDSSHEEPASDAISPGPVPEWIKELRPAEPPKEAPIAQPAEDLPEWLSQLPSIEFTEPARVPESEAQDNDGSRVDHPTTEQEFIDWFAQLQSSSQAPQSGEVKTGETRRADVSVPVSKPLPAAPAGEKRAEIEAAGTVRSTGSGPEIPDWLANLPADQSSDEPEGDSPTPGTMGTAELPSWIKAMQPVETVISGAISPKDETNAKVETFGPLAGLAGVLPMSISDSSRRKTPVVQSRLQINSNQQKYAAALEKMIQEEGQVSAGKPQGLNPSKLLRILLSVILVAAVLLPLLIRLAGTPDLRLFPAEWEKTNLVIQNIPADTPLLVVFEYDPALAGELEAAAAPLINHLVTRGAHLVLVSTSPLGSSLGEKFITITQAASGGGDEGYTNLGYLAGGPAGILSFSTNPAQVLPLTADGKPAWDTPRLAGIQGLSDFGAVIILTDNADTGRFWIEQTKSYVGTAPLLMVISAQAEPMLRPYFDSGQVQGMITGLMGGKTYEQTFASPGLARRYWDAFGFGMLTAILLIAGGSLLSALRTWSTRKKAD